MTTIFDGYGRLSFYRDVISGAYHFVMTISDHHFIAPYHYKMIAPNSTISIHRGMEEAICSGALFLRRPGFGVQWCLPGMHPNHRYHGAAVSRLRGKSVLGAYKANVDRK